MARRYSEKSQEEVRKAVHKYKRGQLNSGKAKVPVQSQEQAIAIGLSKAREKGANVPPAR